MTQSLLALKKQFQDGEISKPDFIQSASRIHNVLFDYVGITSCTDVREIRICADGVSFLIGGEGILLFCPENEARVAPMEVMNFDHYEPVETRLMDMLMVGALTVLDIGANIGHYAIRFAKHLPMASVYAFEPIPKTYKFLQRNVAANHVGQRVSCFNYGLADRSGTVDFFIAPTAGTNASLLNVAEVGEARRVVGLTMTLDQWCSNQDVTPDFIKCDVEGAELLVFRGGRETLLQHRPIVFSELLRKWSKPFGYHPNDVLAYFAELGYVSFAVGDAGACPVSFITDQTTETNYAFLHKEKHLAMIQALSFTRGSN